MNDYYFIYTNALGTFSEATSMPFIARHTNCRAIPKGEIDACYISIQAFLSAANGSDTIAIRILQVNGLV